METILLDLQFFEQPEMSAVFELLVLSWLAVFGIAQALAFLVTSIFAMLRWLARPLLRVPSFFTFRFLRKSRRSGIVRSSTLLPNPLAPHALLRPVTVELIPNVLTELRRLAGRDRRLASSGFPHPIAREETKCIPLEFKLREPKLA